VIYSPHHRRNVSRAGGSGIDPRWDNLVAGWKLDEESDGLGAVARADVLGALELTDNNTVPSTAGLIGNAASFTAASSEYLSHVHDASLNFGSAGEFTIVFWYKYGSTQPRFSKDDGGANRSWVMLNQVFYLFYDGGGPVTTAVGAVPNDGDFHMIAVWWAAGGKVYASVDDGVPTASAGNVATSRDTAAPFWMGRFTTNYAGGAFDEFGIFNKAKDSAWITDIYNGGAGRSYPN